MPVSSGGNGAPSHVGQRISFGDRIALDGKPVNHDGIQFWGQSFMAAPNGQVQYRASIDKEEVIVQPADLDKVEFSRTHWPFLRDRRIDAYDGITRRFAT